jgi:hypothetical protein
VLTVVLLCCQGLRVEMGAALAAGHADLEGREAAVKEAERRLAAQQVGRGDRQALGWQPLGVRLLREGGREGARTADGDIGGEG